MAKHKKSTAKKTVAKPAPKKIFRPAVKAAPAKPSPKAAPAKSSRTMEKSSKKSALRASIMKRKAPAKPIAFSLDEVRAIAKTVTSKTNLPFPMKDVKAGGKPGKIILPADAKPAKPSHVKAASLADILGFNPKKAKPADPADAKDVPEKFKRYYKLLIDLRTHLTAGIELHSETTLKRSAKDDSGDLSSYGQHSADAGTDTFDRDFALSLVSSEQEALAEIDAAIKRIHDGTYGNCEISGKPIAKDRLLAVPFTRNSAEAQKNLERNRYRARTAGGLFGESGEEGASSPAADDGGGDE